MLDLFTIFSKGGIVLWYFQGTTQLFTPSVNALIKTVILQERGGIQNFTHDSLALRYKLDNEFELVFVVAYQKILQLSYIDKFLDDIQLEFRDKYKDRLTLGRCNALKNFDFDETFLRMLKETEEQAKESSRVPRKMKTYGESEKSQKSVKSMIISSKYNNDQNTKKGKEGTFELSKSETKAAASAPASPGGGGGGEEGLSQDEIMKNREKLFGKARKSKSMEKSKSPEPARKGKVARVWEHGGTSKDAKTLDYSGANGHTENQEEEEDLVNPDDMAMVGQMRVIRDIEESEDEEDDEREGAQPVTKATNKKSSGGLGFLSGLKNLVGSKTLTREDIQPALDKMRDHLIAKNVAADIAEKLCESVGTRLVGRVVGTFNTIAATVKAALEESCIQILSPRRRVNILRDAMEARAQRRPYTIAFCGVNGVGKSTNLAKVTFWLIENGFRVLIAACDTFRAGAVEQLRTHTRKLNALHPAEEHGGAQMVQLYEKGYGKDAAGIAMEAINYARDTRLDVVMIDTAGRMQDNEPLMRALSKLIKVNQPDLVLFVGEALVGNEAVDQLTKFNQALADHSTVDKPHLIDGILLTKFDTIDDQVGAAISMTYTTGQPIVFVGTGQTYTDLKNLNAKAVVNSLLKG